MRQTKKQTGMSSYEKAQERVRVGELAVAALKLVQASEDAEAARMFRIVAEGLERMES